MKSKRIMTNHSTIKPITDNFPVPTPDILRRLSKETDEEVFTICRYMDKKKEKISDLKYFCSFLEFGLKSINNRHCAISRLSNNYLTEILILLRNVSEITVDVCWVYSFFEENTITAEKLSERFFKLSGLKYNAQADVFRKASQENIFFKGLNNFTSTLEETFKKIELIGFNAFDPNELDPKLKRLQEIDWRALPGLIKKKKTLDYKVRAKKAEKLLLKKCNSKKPSLIENWDFLNWHTHFWSFSAMKLFDNELLERMYSSYLNVALGYTHDLINLNLSFLNINPNLRIREIRTKMVWA